MFKECKLGKEFKMRIEEKIFNEKQLLFGFSSEEIQIMNLTWVLLE